MPSAALTFEGSGSGEPSGDDQTEEEEEPEEEEGSGNPTEASGTEEPVGKSMLFHFITIILGGEGCEGGFPRIGGTHSQTLLS